MNVVATSLGIRERPRRFLTAIVEADRAGQPLETIRRRCLRIGDQLGFLFGNGLLANFLAEYYAPGEYGPGRAAWLLMRAFGLGALAGPFMQQALPALRRVGARRRRACSSGPPSSA